MSTENRNIAIEQGLNLETFEAFRSFARDNRAAVQFALEASGIGEGRAVHTVARTGPYTLGGQRIDRPARDYVYHLGAHREVEEALGFLAPTDRAEATEVVLAALTACINAVVSTSALRRGIVLRHLETTVQIPWDPAVFLHLEEPEREGELVDQFGELEVQVRVAADELDAEDIAYLQQSLRRSAVYNLLRVGHSCRPSVAAFGEDPRTDQSLNS